MSIFKKKYSQKEPQKPAQKKNSFAQMTDQEIYTVALTHPPMDVQSEAGKNELRNAIKRTLPFYDGISDINTAIMLNDPSIVKAGIETQDTDTLLVAFKALAFKASETPHNEAIGLVQHHIILVLRKRG